MDPSKAGGARLRCAARITREARLADTYFTKRCVFAKQVQARGRLRGAHAGDGGAGAQPPARAANESLNATGLEALNATAGRRQVRALEAHGRELQAEARAHGARAADALAARVEAEHEVGS